MSRLSRKPRTIAYTSENLRLAVTMLRLALRAPTTAFGRRESYAPDLEHYSAVVDTYLSLAPTEEVQLAKLEVLCGGHTFDIRRADEMAEYRIAVAEQILGEGA